MKKRYVAVALFVVGFIALAGNNYYQTQQYKARQAASTQPAATDTAAAPENKPAPFRLATIDIGGFGCPSCPDIAKTALKGTKGVIDATTTETGQGSKVLYDPAQVTLDGIRQSLGYPIDKVVSDEPTTSSSLE